MNQLFPSNYIVTIHDMHGRREIHCDTRSQVFEVIGSRAFGGLYSVESPTKKPTLEFVPF